MRSERASVLLRHLLLSLSLLVGCSQVLGLEDGRDQGACESNAECAPGYECKANTCTLCASGSNCEDTAAAGSGGSNVLTGGKGGGDTSGKGGKGGSSASVGDGGEVSSGGAGGEPAQSGGSSGSGGGATGVGGFSIPPLPF